MKNKISDFYIKYIIIITIIIVISEETGKISICQNGRLVTDFSEKELTKYLEENWQQSPENLI